MTGQPDLFDPRGLSGLSQANEVITAAQEQELIERIKEIDLEPFRFQGWEGKRLTASFGWHYDFSNASIEEAAPIPDWLLPARQLAAQFAGLKATDLVQALLICYPPGATLGWHRDRPVFEHVLGISLGTTVMMRFRRRRVGGFQRHAAALPPRSLYHLAGEARHLWEHSIPATDVTRWSITFRSLSEPRARSPFQRRQTA